MGTLTIKPDLPYAANGDDRTAVSYTYRTSTKANKSPTYNSTKNEHSIDPSISARCIGNPGTPDTSKNDRSGGYTEKLIRKYDRRGDHRVQGSRSIKANNEKMYRL